MKMRALWCGLSIAVCALAANPAAGALLNSDFSSGTDDWAFQVDPLSGEATDYGVTSSYQGNSDVLWVSVENSADVSDASVSVSTDSDDNPVWQDSMWIPTYTTAMEFYAAVDDSQAGDATWNVQVKVSYFDNGLDAYNVVQAPVTIDNSNAAWGLRSFPMPNVNPQSQSLPMILTILVESQNDLSGEDTSTVTAYFDDFTFVPEPGTLGVLAIGAVAAIRRRRR